MPVLSVSMDGKTAYGGNQAVFRFYASGNMPFISAGKCEETNAETSLRTL